MIENIFAGIPAELPEELEKLLATGSSFRMQRIVSRGHASAADQWYDEDDYEWVIMLSGAATLVFEEGNRTVQLSPGDYVLIPPHCRHRVGSTAPSTDSVWLALYFDS